MPFFAPCSQINIKGRCYTAAFVLYSCRTNRELFPYSVCDVGSPIEIQELAGVKTASRRISSRDRSQKRNGCGWGALQGSRPTACGYYLIIATNFRHFRKNVANATEKIISNPLDIMTLICYNVIKGGEV